MKKKYRLILLSLPISSLFIKSYLYKSNKNYENIFIYTTPKTNFKKLNFNDLENFKLCNLPFKNFKGKSLRYNLNFNISNLKKFYFFDRKQRGKFDSEVKNFKKFLLRNNIDLNSVIEVNYGWPNLAYLTFNIFSDKVVFNKFEHGCGDIRNTIQNNIFLFKLKYNLSNYFFFNFIRYPMLNNCTIFFKEIKKIINNEKNLKKISILNVKREIIEAKKRIIILKKPEKGRSMILMVDYLDVKSLKNKKEILKYFNSLFKKILKDKNILINQKKIKNIYVKSKIHSSVKLFEKDINIIFKKVFSNKLNLFFLENYIGLNYNVEYILKIFKCELILSSFSQGQINSEKIFNLRSYIIDKWYVDYWKSMQKKDLIHVDYKWLFDFFYKRYKYAFKNTLPIRI